MPCKRVQERLSDYVDGDLGPLARLSTSLHLRHCEGCRKALASLEHTVGLLRKLRGRSGETPGSGDSGG